MYKIKKMTIIIIYEVDVRGKRGVVEEKKSMAKLKDCPNKLISLLGVKKTPQMRAMLTLHYSSTSDARFFFSLFDSNFFIKGGKLCPFFTNLYKITVLLIP
jgi:hypothetical protein